MLHICYGIFLSWRQLKMTPNMSIKKKLEREKNHELFSEGTLCIFDIQYTVCTLKKTSKTVRKSKTRFYTP